MLVPVLTKALLWCAAFLGLLTFLHIYSPWYQSKERNTTASGCASQITHPHRLTHLMWTSFSCAWNFVRRWPGLLLFIFLASLLSLMKMNERARGGTKSSSPQDKLPVGSPVSSVGGASGQLLLVDRLGRALTLVPSTHVRQISLLPPRTPNATDCESCLAPTLNAISTTHTQILTNPLNTVWEVDLPPAAGGNRRHNVIIAVAATYSSEVNFYEGRGEECLNGARWKQLNKEGLVTSKPSKIQELLVAHLCSGEKPESTP